MRTGGDAFDSGSEFRLLPFGGKRFVVASRGRVYDVAYSCGVA